MKVHEIMTARVRCVSPENTLVEAAGLMRQLDIGAVPVCDDKRPIGMLTDRDIAIRAVADGRDPNTTTVGEAMSPGVILIPAEEHVEDLVRLMENKKVRRVLVVDRAGRLVGIVALGDIAVTSNPAFSGLALREVSESAHTLRGRRGAAYASRPPLLRMRTPGPSDDSRDMPGSSRDGATPPHGKNGTGVEAPSPSNAPRRSKAARSRAKKQRSGRAAQKEKRSVQRAGRTAGRKR